ncbi:glyoxylate carboligase [Streptomyces viridochromogenes DSM 40736]|uniref:Glyoxylate carboligase n=1 Tax=Streptomyces viridochromogenes (strain DSM 40736 / JCM 4977 / BCRC 1201 / Tue 494) TaxID=591159 RepID=D9X2Y6_STRVT|nr:glyoxylate carboligase [Streptomyces viridochromogenes DSM 40736]
MVGLQTSHRYGNATFLESDFVLGIGNRWANRHTGRLDVYTAGRTFVHVDIEPTQLGRIFAPDYGIASDARAALELFVEVAKDPAPQASRDTFSPLRPRPRRRSSSPHRLRSHRAMSA